MKIDLGQTLQDAASPAGGARPAAKNQKSTSTWQPAPLPYAFDLMEAVDKAYSKATGYVNGLLDENDLYVAVDGAEWERIGVVRQKDTDATVKTYDGVEMLRLFAHNQAGRGIIVNATV